MEITIEELEIKIESSPRPSEYSAFVDSICGNDHPREYYKPHWTGWKCTAMKDRTKESRFTDKISIPDGPLGFAGQWVYFTGTSMLDTQFTWVNVPGMESGTCSLGESFEIGTEQIYANTPMADLERIIREGFSKLTDIVLLETARV
jgi:hypothetical protein